MKQTTRAKGNYWQDQAVKILKKLYPGCAVHNQKSIAKQIMRNGKPIWVSQRNDIFGCIDLIVMTQKQMYFVQVTGHTAVKKRADEMRVIPWCHDVAVWLMQKKKERGRWVVKRFNESLGFTKWGEIQNGKWVDK